MARYAVFDRSAAHVEPRKRRSDELTLELGHSIGAGQFVIRNIDQCVGHAHVSNLARTRVARGKRVVGILGPTSHRTFARKIRVPAYGPERFAGSQSLTNGLGNLI